MEGVECATEGVDELAKGVVMTEEPVLAKRDSEWEQVTDQDRISAPVKEAPVAVESMVAGSDVAATAC
uniref:Uncharacterized protein n=1 Tax=Peronospora matthiolae TaxID=2874970 RepID=A0AAV1TWA2_9STRA